MIIHPDVWSQLDMIAQAMVDHGVRHFAIGMDRHGPWVAMVDLFAVPLEYDSMEDIVF